MLRRGFGWVLILAGIAVFAIRLLHPGPYPFPGGGNLRAGLLALALGAWLARDWLAESGARRALNAVAVVAGCVVLFFALYSTLAELEEVVTLRVEGPEGRADLRLWIVDRDAAAWVTMPRAKAEAFALDGARAQLLRGGRFRCVVPELHDDRESLEAAFALRQEKYAVQRLAIAVGVMEPTPSYGVALRLDPCPGA